MIYRKGMVNMVTDQEIGSIQIENLTKVYYLYDKNTDRIRETFHICLLYTSDAADE